MDSVPGTVPSTLQMLIHLNLITTLSGKYRSNPPYSVLFFFFLIYFIYGCVGSSLLCEGSLQLWQAGATPHRGARASRYRGLSRRGAQAPDAQAQQLWPTGPAAPRHVGSSQTRARTRVPRTGRRTPNHCATREALQCSLRIRWDNGWNITLVYSMCSINVSNSLLFSLLSKWGTWCRGVKEC